MKRKRPLSVVGGAIHLIVFGLEDKWHGGRMPRGALSDSPVRLMNIRRIDDRSAYNTLFATDESESLAPYLFSP